MSEHQQLTSEEYNRKLIRSLLLASLLAVLTMFFCIYVADGVFGLQGLKHREVVGQNAWGPVTESWTEKENQTGAVVFWVFLIGLPILFSRWIGWHHTLVNYLVYPFLWFAADACVETHHGHFFLRQGTGWFGFERLTNPIAMTLCFFVVHSIVFAISYAVRTAVKKMKTP